MENYWSEQSGKDEVANLKRRPLELQKYYRKLHKIIQKRWRIPVSAIIPLEEGKELIIIITNYYHSFKKFLHFWLAKIPPIIYHNWLLSNNLEEFCNMWKMTSTVAQHNCQKAEQLTKKTWWRGWVVLVVSTKWRNISLVSRFVISKSNAKSVPYDSVFVVIFIMYKL